MLQDFLFVLILQLSYAIGVADPLSFYIDCKGTNKVELTKILDKLREMVDLTPCGIIKHLNLQSPIYLPTSSYGHFGRKSENDGKFSWEKLDLKEELKNCF